MLGYRSFKEGGSMLRWGDVDEIQELRRQGLSITQIGTLTGFDRKTIRKYLDNPRRRDGQPRH